MINTLRAAISKLNPRGSGHAAGPKAESILPSAGPGWRSRIFLELAALVMVVLAVVLLLWPRGTSGSTVTTTVPTLPPVTATPTVAAAPSVTPGATATPTVTITPTVIVTPVADPSSSVTASVVQTANTGVASDTLIIALLSGAALFALIGAFYNRITGITGPGGWAITLSPAQRKAAAEAVAKTSPARNAGAVTATGEEPGSGPPSPAAVRDAPQVADSEVTVLTLDYADSLLRTIRTDPPGFLALVAALKIPPQEARLVQMNNDISPELWDFLAQHARSRLAGDAVSA